MNHTPILPVPLPANTGGLKPSVSLKRCNPATGVPFKCGDLRADKCRFWGYKSIVARRTGFLREHWLSPKSFEKVAAQRTKYYRANVETIAAQKAEYYKANVETIAAQRALYRAANVEKVAAQRAVYRAANAKQLAANQVQYAKDNPGKVNAINARRRAAKLLRTPPWLTKEQRAEIEAIYVLCAERTKVTGVPHAVDHVIPLVGRTVSGLHIAANLQIITASENCSQNNKYVQE